MKSDFYINSMVTEDGDIELYVSENMCNTFIYPEFLLSNYSNIKCIDDKSIERVLDVGCGAGPFSVFWGKRGKIVNAIDINPIAIECCNKNIEMYSLQDNVVAMNIGINEYVSVQRYDLVVCNPPYGDDTYKRKNLASQSDKIYRKINSNVFDAEVDDFLTNCWRDLYGKDVVDYIFEKSNDLLNPTGKILLVCGDDFIDGLEYMIKKLDNYNNIDLLFCQKYKKHLCIVDSGETYECDKIYNIIVFQR